MEHRKNYCLIMKFTSFLVALLFVALSATAQIFKPVSHPSADCIYVVDSVDNLPDSLELYEEQR